MAVRTRIATCFKTGANGAIIACRVTMYNGTCEESCGYMGVYGANRDLQKTGKPGHDCSRVKEKRPSWALNEYCQVV